MKQYLSDIVAVLHEMGWGGVMYILAATAFLVSLICAMCSDGWSGSVVAVILCSSGWISFILGSVINYLNEE